MSRKLGLLVCPLLRLMLWVKGRYRDGPSSQRGMTSHTRSLKAVFAVFRVKAVFHFLPSSLEACSTNKLHLSEGGVSRNLGAAVKTTTVTSASVGARRRLAPTLGSGTSHSCWRSPVDAVSGRCRSGSNRIPLTSTLISRSSVRKACPISAIS